MEKEMMSLKIDEDVVRGVLEKQIQAAIVQQLGNQDILIERAVAIALSQKVSNDGKVSNYSSDNKHDFLEVLAKKSVQSAAKEALAGWLKENSHKVKAAVLKELKKPARQNSIARAYADAIEDSLKCSWRMSCDISFQETR